MTRLRLSTGGSWSTRTCVPTSSALHQTRTNRARLVWATSLAILTGCGRWFVALRAHPSLFASTLTARRPTWLVDGVDDALDEGVRLLRVSAEM